MPRARGEKEDRCTPGSPTEMPLMAAGLEDLSSHQFWPSDDRSLCYWTIVAIFNNQHFSREAIF